MVYSNTAVYGGKLVMVNPVTWLSFVPCLKHSLNAFLIAFFSGLNFYTLSKTLIQGHAAQSFKSANMVNNACKYISENLNKIGKEYRSYRILKSSSHPVTETAYMLNLIVSLRLRLIYFVFRVDG